MSVDKSFFDLCSISTLYKCIECSGKRTTIIDYAAPNLSSFPSPIVAAVVFAAYVRFLASLPASTAVGFIVAGAVYVGGAVGVELATEPYLYNDELDTLGYNLWTAVEEAMEMGGVLYFLSTLKRYVFEFISPVVSIEIRRR